MPDFGLSAIISDFRAAIILIAAAILAFQFFSQSDGEHRVEVTVDGESFGTYDLSEDQTVEINDTNRLIIEGGEARMEWADCPDQVCVNHRAVERDGESIICLPNKVVVSVESSEANELDGIAQ